ncbi:Blue-light-activated protein [Gimesia panareensis]|uniref:histidine kinase n=1 Tax=Gimesia panareensis TaxID=2527978 RepID=A0A518FGG1_9PLAN|nr:PAS domain S-box protein [Gimesia panareensis]QDV15425.1 Blue-light-activated protein [Gimesia panareensis]
MNRLNWHQAVLQNMVDAVIAVDDRQQIMLVNPAAERLLGQQLKEIQGQAFFDIFIFQNEQTRTEMHRRLESVLQTGTPSIFVDHASLTNREGRRLVISGDIAPIYGHASKIMGALVVIYAGKSELNPGLRTEDLQNFVTNAPIAIALFDKNMRYLATSQRWIDAYHLDNELLPGRSHYEVFPEIPNHWKVAHQQALSGTTLRDEELFLRKDGSVQWDRWILQPWYESPTSIGGILALTEDFTDRKHLEQENQELLEQLVASQKIESIGRLTAGIAHDFNNMLNVIQGHVGLALLEKDLHQPLYEHLTEIRDAADRSTDLIQQLLGFASKEDHEPRLVNVNQNIEEMLRILRRLINEEVELVWEPESEGCIVKMDPSQLDQILANLCVNASDAISGIGKITLQTLSREFDQDFCALHPGYLPGQFAVLAVSDTGTGMDEETQTRIFEPFFTTKPAGKGTGIGLSTVFGIVQQNQGFIQVESQPGCGSTFQVFLPCRRDETPSHLVEPAFRTPGGTDEMILLIDDEPMLAKISREILLSLGYRVITATSPRDGIQMMMDFKGTIDLLITDVVMPEMSGKELFRAIQELQPDLKVLYMSGYSANVMDEHGINKEDAWFLKKPFSRDELAVKVRQVLEPS